ncbi:MAG: hypothetical protein ACJ77M_16885 [Thermoleophilaceae bacterium]
MTKRSRVEAIFGRYGRNKVLVFLAVVVLALTTALSGAIYVVTTSSDASTNAGSIALTNDKDGATIVDASNMKPGDSRNATATIHNTGDSAAYQVVGDTATGTGTLLSTLTMTIDDVTIPATPVNVYTGAFNGAFGPNAGHRFLDLGTFAAGETRTYKVTIAWPSNQTSSSLQGTTASRALHFNAAQL